MAVFAATGIITLLALIGRLVLGGEGGRHHSYYLKKLFLVLVVEIAMVSVALYRDHAASTASREVADLRKEVKTLNDKPGGGAKPEPPDKPQRMTLSDRAYATSDGPRTDHAEVKIPDGWRYVSNSYRVWTRNGDIDIDPVALVPDKKDVRSVKMPVSAEKRGAFAGRNWVGIELSVTIERDS